MRRTADGCVNPNSSSRSSATVRELSFDRFIVDVRLLVGAFDLHDDRPQTVVAGADRHALPIDLVDRFPRFVAEAFGFGVIGVEDLPFAHHRAAGEAGGGVLFGQFFIEGGFENGDFAAFHPVGSFVFRKDMQSRGEKRRFASLKREIINSVMSSRGRRNSGVRTDCCRICGAESAEKPAVGGVCEGPNPARHRIRRNRARVVTVVFSDRPPRCGSTR